MHRWFLPLFTPKIGVYSVDLRNFWKHFEAYCHDSQIVLALLATGEAYVCDLRKQNRSRIELLETITDEGLEEEENNGQGILRYISSVCHYSGLRLILVSCRSPMTAARFDPTGKNIFVGTASGSILVFNTRTKTVKLLASHMAFILNTFSDDCSSQNFGCRCHEGV